MKFDVVNLNTIELSDTTLQSIYGGRGYGSGLLSNDYIPVTVVVRDLSAGVLGVGNVYDGSRGYRGGRGGNGGGGDDEEGDGED